MKPFFQKPVSRREFEQKIAEMAARITATATLFEGDTSERQKRRIEKSGKDPLEFMLTYLPHYFEADPAPFHTRVLDLVLEQGRMTGVALPRGAGKSTLITFGLTLWAVVTKTTMFTLICSETEDQAEGFTAFIRLELESNARLIHDFGNFKPKRAGNWSDADFTTAHGVRVKARGWTQKVRGLKNGPHRPDTAVLDDIESNKTVRNRQTGKEKLNWVKTELWPGLHRTKRRVIWVGNIFNARLAFKNYIEMADSEGNRIVHSLVVKAINARGESFWPAAFPLASLLEDKRVMGTPAFNAEMMHEPRNDEGLFREEWIKRVPWRDIKNIEMEVAEFLDPALGKNKNSDTTAIVKIGRPLDPEQRNLIYVLNSFVRIVSIEMITDIAYSRQEQLPAQVIGIEDVAFQYLLQKVFNDEAKKRGVNLPFKMIKPVGAKQLRIAGLSPLVERNIIIFVSGPESGDNETLVEQLLDYDQNDPNPTDDGPDALAQAVKLLLKPSEPKIMSIAAPTRELREEYEEEDVYTGDHLR